MQITDLSSQKNNPKRFNLYLDGKFVLGLDVQTVVDEGLKIGKVLTDEQWNKLKEKVEEGTLYNNALNFLSFRPRSEKEVRDHFKKKKIVGIHVDKTIAKLKKLKLLDDEKFCLWWIEQRNNFRPKGIRALEMELREKGVDRETVRNVLEDKKSGQTEKETCLALGSKWLLRRHVNLAIPKQKERLFRYLASRGFDFSVVLETIDTLKKKE